MEATTYTIQGYDWQFLNEQPITFEHPLPSVCICAKCEVFAADAAQLPCRHTLCGRCLKDACDGDCCEHRHRFGWCPLDGEFFVEEDVVDAHFPLAFLMILPVRCFHAGLGCPFDGELGELQHHLLECIFGVGSIAGA
ncbi:TNF receptor-associated factor 6-A-like [Dermacentor variabilis]|uniref:TNF receptor-associated factor 6-A-like n=1 Tax=Dermacentor variabilis TaxID=34621 RepID=UPI003F5C6FA5